MSIDFEAFLSALEDYVEAKIKVAQCEAGSDHPEWYYETAYCAKRRMLSALKPEDE